MQIQRQTTPSVPASEVDAFLEASLDRTSRARFESTGWVDVTCEGVATGALRVHASRGRRGPRLAIRLLATSIPDLRELGLPPAIAGLLESRDGLVLISGPTRSGKSLTIASLLERINQSRALHAVVLESNSEHRFRWQSSMISQYEIGRDVSTFAAGIEGGLRSDPDVLVIAEMRGRDVVTAALQAAEDGHLVIGAVRCPTGTALAVQRIVALYESHEQEPIRHRLAEVLRGVVALRLLPALRRRGQRAAAEVMIVTDAVRRLIREGALHQARSLLGTSARDGSLTLERHLNELVASGEISVEHARAAAQYPNEIVASDLRG